MCEVCAPYYEALIRMVGEAEAHEILWSATAFPAAGGDYVARQLGDAIVKLQLGRDPIADAPAEMDRAMGYTESGGVEQQRKPGSSSAS